MLCVKIQVSKSENLVQFRKYEMNLYMEKYKSV